MESMTAPYEDAPTTELLSGAVGDRCSNCQAALASDQRYCVNCGHRRGKSRFSAGSLAATAAASAPASPSDHGGPHRSRVSAGTTLVAGVATLLLAMGVGVLIGHNTSSARAPAPQIITVGAGGGTGASSAATPSTSSSKTGKASKKRKVTKVVVTAHTAQVAASAAAKVLGGAAPKNPTVTVGQSCSADTAGCQNGKFTGNFFGP
jgi:hypothetical protein